jgi:arginyl-tRNA synthetase
MQRNNIFAMIKLMKQIIQEILSAVCLSLGYDGVVPDVSRPENAGYGEYTTNVAMVIAHQNHLRPIDIAKKIQCVLEGVVASTHKDTGDLTMYQTGQTVPGLQIKPEWKNALQAIEKIEIAGPGFLNIYFSKAKLSTLVLELPISENSAKIRQKSTKRKIMVEFAHPNTHKAFHIGHLRNITTGECMVRLLEAVGNTVIRVNYQGDIGMHIAKCLYGIEKGLSGQAIPKDSATVKDKVDFLGASYAKGAGAYEEGAEAKKEIERINKQIYAKDAAIYPLYEKTRAWSLEYFDYIYKRVGSTFDRLYFESEVYESGKKLVEDGVKKGIFVKDAGAVIFPGEKFKLHNRVFITSDGNPTYEAKDMGLGKLQFSEHYPDLVIHCVGSEQSGYFQVIIEALAQILPETKGKEYHLVYGWVNLKSGKMSSRTGVVVLGEWLIDTVKEQLRIKVLDNISKYKDSGITDTDDISEALAIAAVKYSFLKVGTTQEMSFDINESINLHGDSGPYLLYTYARCQSVLRKSEKTPPDVKEGTIADEEHALARILLYYPEVVEEAARLYAPNILCTYLFTLAQAFNLFYQNCPILESSYRLKLTEVAARVLDKGLNLLGIATVERM